MKRAIIGMKNPKQLRSTRNSMIELRKEKEKFFRETFSALHLKEKGFNANQIKSIPFVTKYGTNRYEPTVVRQFLENGKVEQECGNEFSCKCNTPLCGKCLSSNCLDKTCSTHKAADKKAWRRNWEAVNGKPFPHPENF